MRTIMGRISGIEFRYLGWSWPWNIPAWPNYQAIKNQSLKFVKFFALHVDYESLHEHKLNIGNICQFILEAYGFIPCARLITKPPVATDGFVQLMRA
ncbi:hypothetical protein HGO38_25665 [Rhizobium sp. CG5]|nr:hypothetical protein [Rhizobium sp. CG5]